MDNKILDCDWLLLACYLFDNNLTFDNALRNNA